MFESFYSRLHKIKFIFIVLTVFAITNCSTVHKSHHQTKSNHSNVGANNNVLEKAPVISKTVETVVVNTKPVVRAAKKMIKPAIKPVIKPVAINQVAKAPVVDNQELIQKADMAIKANQEDIAKTTVANVESLPQPKMPIVKVDAPKAESSVFNLKGDSVKNILTGLFIALLIIPMLMALYMWTTNREIKVFNRR